MTDLPDPSVPADCDLRGYDYMPLFGHKLFSSTFDAKATDAEFRAAMRLWWSAYAEQCPAASLPDDDDVLCKAAGFGRDVKAWRKVKDRALHGFVKCSDGRLYHFALSEEAVKAYAFRLKNDAKRDTDRERLQRWRDARKKRAGNANETRFNTADETGSETPDETGGETPNVAVDKTGLEVKKEEPPIAPPSDAPRSKRAAPMPRGCRLPQDWEPRLQERDLALGLGVDVAAAAEEFRNFWHAKAGKDAAKLEWDLTFRNRLKELAERGRFPIKLPGWDRAVDADPQRRTVMPVSGGF